VFSLNVPVPGRVRRLAADLHPHLVAFDRVREAHTLVVKRLDTPGAGEHDAVEARARRAVAGTTPFAARVDGVEVFEDPPTGPEPVVYLAVDSPGLQAAHERLCEAFDPVDGLEGDAYTPHVTLARGGSIDAARNLAGLDVDPVEWMVHELAFFTRKHGRSSSRVPLSA
jgi:2'-5' RNA ligase